MSCRIEGKLFSHLSLGPCLFHEGWSFNLFGLYLPMRLKPRAIRDGDIMEKWGFTVCDRSIHFNWGNKTKVIHFPWDWKHLKHEVRRPDESWVPYVGSYEKDKEPDGRWFAEYHYVYRLNSGEVQGRVAEIHVGRREWRWRWFMWLPWPSMKIQSIDVAFDGEVGEKSGSWKGGTIGCGYDMKPNETPLETLRRMERDRKF